jgi:hypothetical protein
MSHVIYDLGTIYTFAPTIALIILILNYYYNEDTEKDNEQ